MDRTCALVSLYCVWRELNVLECKFLGNKEELITYCSYRLKSISITSFPFAINSSCFRSWFIKPDFDFKCFPQFLIGQINSIGSSNLKMNEKDKYIDVIVYVVLVYYFVNNSYDILHIHIVLSLYV